MSLPGLKDGAPLLPALLVAFARRPLEVERHVTLWSLLRASFEPADRAAYLRWVHATPLSGTPIMVGGSLEVMTRAHWWYVPCVWLPIACWLAGPFFAAASKGEAAWAHAGGAAGIAAWGLGLVALGVFVWTLVEYLMHRFLFHLDENLPANGAALLIHFVFHGGACRTLRGVGAGAMYSPCAL